MVKKKDVSIYLSYLLRHNPADIGLHMDKHGWVEVEQLINGINNSGKYIINLEQLKDIVANDNKGRYRFNEYFTRIKACQGHSIEWVEPELEYKEPPQHLYHGTTVESYKKMKDSGYISKMKRHAVHMQALEEKAWQSAKRWHIEAVVLKIDARNMYKDGYIFGISENEVWLVEQVPMKYIIDVLEE